MEHRTLGASSLRVPSVIFGAWVTGGWYWGGSDDAAAIDAMRLAIDLGMDCIDTAPMYGCGRSEEVVGRAIKGRRDRVLIATKCGLRWDTTEGEHFFDDVSPATGAPMKVYRNLKARSIEEECEASLRRLGIDCIDLYQCHWPDATTPLEETVGALQKLQKAGKIREIGVSNFTPAMMERCAKAGARIASDQPEYSLLKREIESDVLPHCRRANIGAIVYTPIYQGLLTGKITMDTKFAEDDYRTDKDWIKPANRGRVIEVLDRVVRPIAQRHGATPGQVAIAWVIGEPGVTSAIVGARNAKQVEENALAAGVRLGAEERGEIRRAFEGLGKAEV